MKLIFLGTGTSQGVPVISCKCKVCRSTDSRDHRLRTSALLVTDEGKNILFDIGPDFREQMLREKVTHLEGILVTHAHRDHVAGLDDIRAFNYVQHQKMQLYANDVALNIIKRDYHYIFSDHPYPGLPEVDLHCVDGDEPFMVAGYKVTAIKAMHKVMPILGYRIGDLTYITDANHIEPEELDKVRGSKLLVLNALIHEKHFSHFCLPEALEVVKEVKPERAYFTHMSHEMGVYEEIQKEVPEGVTFAYDGLTIEI